MSDEDEVRERILPEEEFRRRPNRAVVKPKRDDKLADYRDQRTPVDGRDGPGSYEPEVT